MLIDLIRALMSGGTERAKELLIVFLMWLPIIMLSLSFHEASHAFIAYKLGDPTARNFGRVTLNPVKHLDPIGFIAMLTIGFGWAKPCPVNTRNFRNPKKGFALSSLAGPVSNMILALGFAVLMAIFYLIYLIVAIVRGLEAPPVFVDYIQMFLYYGIYLNVSLAIFNFLPVPPLDGSRILGLILPDKVYYAFLKYERYIGIGFAVLVIMLGQFNISIIDFVVSPVTNLFCSIATLPINWIGDLIF